MEENYYTLSRITEHIQKLLRNTYRREYWIKAEIAKLNYYPKSGHCYPDLVEKSSAGVKAQIRAIIWNSAYNRIQERFRAVTGKELSDGMEILFRAKIDYSPVHGLALHISDIDPDFSLGKMAAAKLKAIQRLKEEGVFYKNKTLPFPLLPKSIAVISVSTSKGYHDFMNILRSNSRGYRFFTMLFPAILQGDVAIDSIMKQLERIRAVAEHFDLVAIIRGGGGDVGLDCYNDFYLARTVATFPLPVISGIGHSTNETVVEMVSHRNTITPTDLAYMLQQQFDNVAVTLQELERGLAESAQNMLAESHNFLASLAGRIKTQQRGFMEFNTAELMGLELRLKKYSAAFVPDKLSELKALSRRAAMSANSSLSASKREPDLWSDRLTRASRRLVESKRGGLQHLEEKLQLMHPVNILKKGFSITRVDGKAVRDASILKEGQEVETEFAHGKSISKVIKINKL